MILLVSERTKNIIAINFQNTIKSDGAIAPWQWPQPPMMSSTNIHTQPWRCLETYEKITPAC